MANRSKSPSFKPNSRSSYIMIYSTITNKINKWPYSVPFELENLYDNVSITNLCIKQVPNWITWIHTPITSRLQIVDSSIYNCFCRRNPTFILHKYAATKHMITIKHVKDKYNSLNHDNNEEYDLMKHDDLDENCFINILNIIFFIIKYNIYQELYIETWRKFILYYGAKFDSYLNLSVDELIKLMHCMKVTPNNLLNAIMHQNLIDSKIANELAVKLWNGNISTLCTNPYANNAFNEEFNWNYLQTNINNKQIKVTKYVAKQLMNKIPKIIDKPTDNHVLIIFENNGHINFITIDNESNLFEIIETIHYQ